MNGKKTGGFLCAGVAVVSVLAFGAKAGDFKHITIDGSFDDWAGIPPAFEDLSDTTRTTSATARFFISTARK